MCLNAPNALPPFVHALSISISLEETDTDQTYPTFWGLQNWFLEGIVYIVGCPTPESHDKFAPPICRSQILNRAIWIMGFQGHFKHW